MIELVVISLQSRCFSFDQKSIPDAAFDYIKILHKKFLFLIHPDFFGKKDEIEMKLINSANVQILQNIVFTRKHSVESQSQSCFQGPRSLIFYIKAGALPDMPSPRKVKVVLTSLHESLREIIEDYYDIDLPPVPKALQRRQNLAGMFTESALLFRSSNQIDIKDVKQFLDSILEKRELLEWREQRRAHLNIVVDTVRKILGVEAIELRHNWSSVNNAKLFRSLEALLVKNTSLSGESNNPICLPWNGLRLVITNDDCSSAPVNGAEGEIQLCPGHVPLQWLETLMSVNRQVVEQAQHMSSVRMKLDTLVSTRLSQILIQKIVSHMSFDEQQRLLGHVLIQVRKGFTCSMVSYHTFLENVIKADAAHSNVKNDRDFNSFLQETETNFDKITKNDTVLPSFHETPFALMSSDSLWLTQLPITIAVIVEDGHGSKPLNTGDIRVDAQIEQNMLIQLLEHTAMQSIKTVALQKRQQHLLRQLTDDLISRLKLRSLSPGVGVSNIEFYDWMERLRDLLNSQANDLSIVPHLRCLQGLPVKVGKYLGLSDEGCVILPVDLPLFENELKVQF